MIDADDSDDVFVLRTKLRESSRHSFLPGRVFESCGTRPVARSKRVEKRTGATDLCALVDCLLLGGIPAVDIITGWRVDFEPNRASSGENSSEPTENCVFCRRNGVRKNRSKRRYRRALFEELFAKVLEEATGRPVDANSNVRGCSLDCRTHFATERGGLSLGGCVLLEQRD